MVTLRAGDNIEQVAALTSFTEGKTSVRVVAGRSSRIMSASEVALGLYRGRSGMLLGGCILQFVARSERHPAGRWHGRRTSHGKNRPSIADCSRARTHIASVEDVIPRPRAHAARVPRVAVSARRERAALRNVERSEDVADAVASLRNRPGQLGARG